MRKAILWITLAMLMIAGAISFTGCGLSAAQWSSVGNAANDGVKKAICSKCNNSGSYYCNTCSGSGKVYRYGETSTCGSCGGSGRIRCSH